MQPAFLVPLVLVLAALGGCQFDRAAPADSPGASPELERLAEWLTGVFDSSKQAQEQTGYRDIRLAAAPIWPEREDGIWIYVEQATAEDIRHPYRQRIYHLYEPERGQFVSEVYTLPDPDTAIGSWRNPDMLEEFGPEDLQLRTGCSVYLQRDNPRQFSGATRAQNCASDLNGASYATSEVLVMADGIDSWDRGFNAENEQVWGATEGAYQFRRQQ